jgi:bifunctional DNA-binding transcriptional regulator/antitoxin component of YhaV-PrlF toxin-antitoxin module
MSVADLVEKQIGFPGVQRRERTFDGVEEYPYTENEPRPRTVLRVMTKTLTTPIVVPEAVRRKAGLRRGEQVEFRVSGRAITIVPKETSRSDYPMETVMRIVKEQSEKPMSRRRLATLDGELRAYGTKQAKKVGVKERDVTRIIHESRARRRTS